MVIVVLDYTLYLSMIPENLIIAFLKCMKILNKHGDV